MGCQIIKKISDSASPGFEQGSSDIQIDHFDESMQIQSICVKKELILAHKQEFPEVLQIVPPPKGKQRQRKYPSQSPQLAPRKSTIQRQSPHQIIGSSHIDQGTPRGILRNNQSFDPYGVRVRSDSQQSRKTVHFSNASCQGSSKKTKAVKKWNLDDIF